MNAIVFIVITICFQEAYSIRCYECSSANNTFCVDPALYDADTISKYLMVTECEDSVYTGRQMDFFCRKIVQTIYHDGLDSQVMVTRGCGWVRGYEDCYRVSSDSHIETVCQCFFDGCNGVPHLRYTSWISLISLLIVCF